MIGQLQSHTTKKDIVMLIVNAIHAMSASHNLVLPRHVVDHILRHVINSVPWKQRLLGRLPDSMQNDMLFERYIASTQFSYRRKMQNLITSRESQHT